ncbi:DUF560 domain-containing protein [Lysobacter pythonis]|uniref:DUF560 domain-containing protein n=1 Tax=Solilutibacter pythonis TaxID=2483112 RepID=A0A3M2HX06_9GAMM|nr:surface lipoprotein assembly modifier [Lysobacter pythonis]RMH90737.1 DUF560 domain-containing protein [Lysobacter pythonis]
MIQKAVGQSQQEASHAPARNTPDNPIHMHETPLPRPAARQARALLACLLVVPPALLAQARDDTRLRLDHAIERDARAKERALLEEEARQDASAADTLTIDGQTYTVAPDVDQTGRALYLAIGRRQWADARRFLDRYLQLPGHDNMLVHHAQGALARQAGHLAQAEAEYRALLAIQPDFLPGRLELARVLFENHQDGEAERMFRDIRAGLDTEDIRTRGVTHNVDTFIKSLEKRRSWQGSVAVGALWSSNLNQSSRDRTCLWLDTGSGKCLVERIAPEAIAAPGLDYEAAIARRFPLSGHHGLYVRGLAYGQAWRGHSAFNDGNASLQAGWSFENARHQFTLAPLYEHALLGNRTLYRGYGVQAEWSHSLSPQRFLKVEGSHRYLRHLRQGYDRLDGTQSAVFATLWQSLPGRWTLFGGPDITRRRARVEVESWHSYGLRLGAHKAFGERFDAMLMATLRQRRHAAFNPLLGARREDLEQHWTLLLRAPAFDVFGLTPGLLLRHGRTRSSVDWLYGHERNSASLRLERRF